MWIRETLRPSVLLGALIVSAMAGSGCGSDSGDGDSDSVSGPSDPGTTVSGVPDSSELPDVEDDPDCDPLLPGHCAMPWPSSLYLAEDDSRSTGYTLTFGPTSLPANQQGVHVDPEPYLRLDGYGVSTPILVQYPNLNVEAMPDEYAVAKSMEEDVQILLYRLSGDGELTRVPYWVDLDDWEPNPERKTLYIRPGVILEPGTRYVVALRNLSNTEGERYERSPAFERVLRSAVDGVPTLERRADRFSEILELLAADGVDLDELDLAWDFVTASSDALHGWMLHMRRDGLERVGPSGPEIVFTEPEITPDDEHEWWAWVLRGHIEVPDYMVQEQLDSAVWGNVEGGYIFHMGEDGLPTPSGTREARFYIGVPHSAINGDPHGLVQYGHGFFGTARGTTGSWTSNGQLANENNVIFFGAFLTGMAEDDMTTTETFIFDLGKFPWLADRVHQGLLEYILLARSMKERFGDLDFAADNGITVDTSRMYYLGISQGGIYGATYMALSPDIERGHLGVPGQNYSLLEHRSTNFDRFFMGITVSYRSRADQAIVLSAVQNLWDQTDPSSYWRHITAEPLEGGPPRYVIAAPSKGDLQVTTTSMEVVARSNIGVATMANYDAERSIDLVEETPYPHEGSGIVLFDFGFPWPEGGLNRPPTFTRDDVDAHNAPRWNDAHNQQMFHFFETGEIIDVCGGAPCAFPPGSD